MLDICLKFLTELKHTNVRHKGQQKGEDVLTKRITAITENMLPGHWHVLKSLCGVKCILYHLLMLLA